MAVFSIPLISKSQNKNNTYPPEQFAVIQAKLSNGKPIIGSVNLAYKNYSDKSKYPWCLAINIGLDLKNVTKDGLPSKSESDVANKLEDELINSIKKISTAHYIGHFYNDTFLDIYIYLDNPEKVNDFLQKEVNKKGLLREFGFRINKDTKWETVQKFFK